MNIFKPSFMLHGADYNYEQWLDYPDILAHDFELMKQAKCNVMSVGIFSWSILEPVEGEFHFDWLDTLMDRLAENGMYAILATPSAARPAWLSQKYPEVCLVDENGKRQPHNLRHNHCPTSPIYRQKVGQINTLLAQRYAKHPALMMWHVSNEYGHYNCRCELCLEAFREWLKVRYGSLEALNHAWWTTFWSHRYSDWSQIAPVDPSVHGLMLDWMRFVSDQVLDFYQAETKPLRAITPDIPVTTNFMQPDVGLDYWAFAPHVDLISWDSYPRWHSRKDEISVAVQTAFYHDLHRSFKQRPFLLMESTPSVTNWQGISPLKRPSLHQLVSLQAVAHGSNSVQYFQWRQSRGGSEKFHGAVVSHGGHGDTRTFQEVTAVGGLLAQLEPITDSINQAEVALIYDFQNEWALNLAELPRNQDKNYQKRCIAHYRPFWQQGISVDVINSTFTDLSAYKLIIAPMLYMLQPEVSQHLKDFVENGGTLVMTYLSGLVNQSDLVFLGGAPGPIKDLLGLEVEETDALFDHHIQSIQPGQNLPLPHTSYSVEQIADIIHLQGARSLAQYEHDFYGGSPAVTVNRFGQGQTYYLAGRFEDAFLADFYHWLQKEVGVETAVSATLPTGVTAQVRSTDTTKFTFLLNFNASPTIVDLSDSVYTDVVSGEAVHDNLTLPAYGYRILTDANQ